MMTKATLKRIYLAFNRLKYTPTNYKKGFFKLSYDIVRWIIINQGGINLFVDYGLQEKGSRINDFITEREFKKFEKDLNSRYYLALLEDKMIFYQYLKGLGFPITNNRFIILNNQLFLPGSAEGSSISKIYEYEIDGYMKIINGFAGKNVYRIHVSNKKLFINYKECPIQKLKNITENEIYLIQDKVLQHSEINRINPSCINTLRIITVKTGMETELFHVSQRFGINGNYVDNNSMGNIAVGIHMDSGRLMEKAYTHDPAQFKINKHPDTGIVFYELQVPYYKEAVKLALNLHQYFSYFSIIGWDIAITPEGPLVIEGNNINDLTGAQILTGGLRTRFLDFARKAIEMRN